MDLFVLNFHFHFKILLAYFGCMMKKPIVCSFQLPFEHGNLLVFSKICLRGGVPSQVCVCDPHTHCEHTMPTLPNAAPWQLVLKHLRPGMWSPYKATVCTYTAIYIYIYYISLSVSLHLIAPIS